MVTRSTTKCGGMWPLPVARSEMVDMGVSALHGERYIRFFLECAGFYDGGTGFVETLPMKHPHSARHHGTRGSGSDIAAHGAEGITDDPPSPAVLSPL